MLKTVLCGVALLSLTSAVPAGSTVQDTSPVKCVGYEYDYYEELGCKSVAVDERGCPSSYDCSSLAERAAEKCYYRGQPIDENAKLPEHPLCLAECTCLESPTLNDTSLQFTCANIECPELFMGRLKEGCHRIYEHDKCCSTKEVCPTPEERSAINKCEVNGKSYIEGEKFYPEGEHCTVCICHQNYTGANVSPFCKKIKCDLDLHYAYEISKGCVPIYYGEKSCCPVNWQCPTLSALNVTEEPSVEPGAKTCKLGNLTLNIGDSKSFDGSNAVCQCRVPPHPVCIIPEGHAVGAGPVPDILGAPAADPVHDIFGAPAKPKSQSTDSVYARLG